MSEVRVLLPAVLVALFPGAPRECGVEAATVAEAITRSALERTESRGGHFRDDFPTQHPEWGKHNVLTARGSDGAMRVARVPIAEMPEHLKQVIEEMR